MDPVEHQVSVKLSRVATMTIPFGRAVQRAGVDSKAELYGGKLLVDNMDAIWTPKASVTITTPAGIVGNCNLMSVAVGFTSGLIATKDITAAPLVDLSPYEAIGFLIKPTIAIAAGVLQFGWDKGSTDMSGAPVYLDLPALEAGKWYFASLPFSGVLADRQDVLSIGLNATSDPGTVDIAVDEMRAGALSNGMSGIVNNDQAKENDEAEQYETMLVLARGEMRAQLATGITCVSEQMLYPVPGTGEFTTTEIVASGPAVRASQDMATAGSGVRAIVG